MKHLADKIDLQAKRLMNERKILESEKNHFKDFLIQNSRGSEPFVTYNFKKYFAKSMNPSSNPTSNKF